MRTDALALFPEREPVTVELGNVRRGLVRVLIAKRLDGERMVSDVKVKGIKYPAPYDPRTVFDPLAPANLSNAKPTPKPKPITPDVIAKAVAKGWSYTP